MPIYRTRHPECGGCGSVHRVRAVWSRPRPAGDVSTMGYFLLKPLFSAGRIMLSPMLVTSGVDPLPFLHRHLAADWSDQDEHDKNDNEDALANGEAILSQYQALDAAGNPLTVVVMTEADRSCTVIYILGETASPDHLP